jgi:hypothetical protein
MGGMCSTHMTAEKGVLQFSSENPKSAKRLGDLAESGKLILKCILGN